MLVCVMLLIAPLHSAQAIGLTLSVALTLTAVGLAVKYIGGFIFKALMSLVEMLLQLLSYMPDVIHKIWEIVRDIVNLTFILILIIMAFGTIFQVKEYTYKEMFGPFLISAILINFSFAIGQYLIDLSNGLAHVFFDTIREATGGDITTIFDFGLSSNVTAAPEATSWAKGFIDYTITAFSEVPTATVLKHASSAVLSALFILVGNFALSVILIFALARWVALWLLMIASPAAWVAYALPGHMKSFWKMWWKAFMGWNFFIPIYAFFLMLLAIILKAKEQTKVTWDDIGTQYLQKHEGAAIAASIFNAFGINEFIFFIITVVFMVGGIYAAWKISSSLGGGAGWVGTGIAGRLPIGLATKGMGKLVSFAGKGMGLVPNARVQRVGQWMQRAGTGIGSIKNVNSGVAAGKALGQAGFEKYWGKRAHEQESKAKEAVLRAGGFKAEAAAERKARINHEKDKYKTKLNNSGLTEIQKQTKVMDEIKRALFHGNADEATLLGQIAAEKGWLKDDVQIRDTLHLAGGTQTELGKELFEALKPHLSQATVDTLFRGASGEDLTNLAQLRAEKGWVQTGSAGETEIRETLRLMGGSGTEDGKKYLKTLDDNDFLNVFKTPDEKLTFADSLGTTDDALKRILYLNAGKNNQLRDRARVNEMLDATKNSSADVRAKALSYSDKAVKNFATTFEDRQLALHQPADDASKAIARSMIDSDEILSEKDFTQMVRVLQNNPTANLTQIADPKALEALTRIEQRHPLLAAELSARRSDPSGYTGSMNAAPAPVRTEFVNKMRAKIMNPNIREDEVFKVSEDTWNMVEYQDLVKEKVASLQQAQGRRRKGDPGDGARFLIRLQRMAPPGSARESAVNTVIASSGININP